MTTPESEEVAKLRNEVERVKADLEKAAARAEENLDGWKRAKADYLNLKRETERAQTEIAGFATGALLFELLPIVDNFSRAIQHLSEEDQKKEWTKGILGIYQQLQTFLKDLGLEMVKTDIPFNPEFHEAVAQEPREGVAPDTILEVVAPGYLMHGKLLRPAKVKVATNQPMNESAN